MALRDTPMWSTRLTHPAWKNREPPEEGVTVLDLTRDIEADMKERSL